MIELTEQQRQAIAANPGTPLRLVDPETHKEFVVLSAETYEAPPKEGKVLFASDEEEAAHFGVYPPLFRGMKAFWRDLPALLKSWWKRGKLVAYHGETRVGTARRETRLFRICQARGIPLDEVFVAAIEDRVQPPWEPESFDGTLYEFDDEEDADEQIVKAKES
jgi:hypothetical protein